MTVEKILKLYRSFIRPNKDPIEKDELEEVVPVMKEDLPEHKGRNIDFYI